MIILSEDEMRCKDLEGQDIYLEIPLNRKQLDRLIEEKIVDSVNAARETLAKAGVSAQDLERIVFVGGPTNYKPLRDRVSFELGIPGSIEVNPMTAVAEGASVFAESVDWRSKSRARKKTRGELSSGRNLPVSFNYTARTPDVNARIAVDFSGAVPGGCEFQIDSADTGWTSGRFSLEQGATVTVALTKAGDNVFQVFVFDPSGGPIPLEENKIVITRTAATIEAIPASHSICVEVLDRLGGRPVPDFLIKAGDHLPAKGKRCYKAAESLKAGSSGSLNCLLWQGDIEDPVKDNLFIGAFHIKGSDFDDGVIPAGAELNFEYEILDSGNIVVEVSIPCIRGTFHPGRNLYSRQVRIDASADSMLVLEQGEQTLDRIDEIAQVVDDPKLEQARQRAEAATSHDPDEMDAETTQEARDKVQEALRLLAQVRKEHRKEIRQIELGHVVAYFDEHVRQYARPSEATAFDNLAKTAQRSTAQPDRAFEHQLDELKGKNFEILWRQDWFVIARFKWMASSPHSFADRHRFEELTRVGAQYLRADDIDKLRQVVAQLYMLQIGDAPDDAMFEIANIIKG